MRFVALGLAALLASPPPAGACAAPHLIDVALTADGATLLDDGGVVIETRVGGVGRGTDHELGQGMTLASRGQQVAATMEFIAPGLSVLRPSKTGRRPITMIDSSYKVYLTVSQAKAKAKHAAPKVTSLTSTLPRDGLANGSAPGVPTSSATLTLATPADDDVIAIVVYLVTKDGQQGAAYWHRTSDLVYTFKTGGKGCVPGPRPLLPGEQVAIGFVDKYGRSSPLSAPLSVSP